MKRLLFITVVLLPLLSTKAQKVVYSYEMSAQNYETGCYMIKYSKKNDNPQTSIQVKITDPFGNNLSCSAIYWSLGDTIYINTDEYGMFRISKDFSQAFFCMKVLAPSIKYNDFEECIHFWAEKDDAKIHPEEIVIVLGLRSNSVIHIISEEPLTPEDIRAIKKKTLAHDYNSEILKHIQIEQVVYY